MAAKEVFDPVPSTLKILEVKLGRGSFGVVYSATLDKNSVAVKRFHEELMTSVGSGENVPLENFKTECERLKDLNHPNVVRYIGAYEDKNGPLLVMELMYESLEKYLKRNKGRLSPERVLEICSSVCEGMAYLHGRDKPLIHRDLGSKNVLLTKEGVVKLADFGQSKLLQNRTGSLKTTQPGTISYMPPEALKKGGEYTAKVDSFSLGVLMLEISTQSGPSTGFENIGAVIEVIRHDEDLSLLADAHPLKPLVVWCLQHEKLRPAVAVIHNHVKDVCEKSKMIATLEECLRAKDEAVQDLEGRLEVVVLEKEVALKEEKDRMEKTVRVKAEKLELEKEAWQNLIVTTRNKNSALEEELEKVKKYVQGAEEDKKVLEGELQRLEEEVKLLLQEKDQSDKDFKELEEERGELFCMMERVKQDRREAADEAKELKEKVKLLQESLEEERAEKQQLVDKGQKLEVKVKHLARSSKDKEEDNDFHSFNEEDSPKASQQTLGSDAMKKHKVIHVDSVNKSVEPLQKKGSGSQENMGDSWFMVDDSATCDDEPQKVSQKNLREEIQGLKGQLKQAQDHRKIEFEIRNKMEKEIKKLEEECKMLRGQIQEMEVGSSRQDLLIEEHQTEPKRSGPSKRTERDNPSLSSETTDTQPRSMGERSKPETPPLFRRQHSYDAAVSISVTPPELTESALHRSLESHNTPRRTSTPNEGQQSGLGKQNFNLTIVENLRREKEILEAAHDEDVVQDLKEKLEDAKRTIDSLQVQLLEAVQNYSNENARRKELEADKKARLREMFEWDRNRQASLKDREERALEEKNDNNILQERLVKEIKSREELEQENLTFKQIIEQFQADFNAERKDREAAAGKFADREKEWMEKIRRVEEVRDHFKALNVQLQDLTTHQRHEMERLEREVKESREMADGIAKKMTNQEASFRKQEAEHGKQVHALHKQLEKLNKEVAKLKAELADKKKDAKGSKTIEEAYRRLFDEKKELECKLVNAMEAKSIASHHIAELQQENQTLKAEVEVTRQHLLQTSQDLQGVRTQYRVLSSHTITFREENEKLKQRMLASQHQQQPLPRAHRDLEQEESNVSPDSSLPSPINWEMRHKARQYKKAVEQRVPAPDEIDESILPFDPNLECPHCGKRFRRGQIREYRYHLDDEHAPSLM